MNSKNNFVLILVVLLSPIGQMGIDIYVSALPMMATFFAVDGYNIQQTVTIYLVAFAIGQLIYGPLCDAIGRKKVLYIGIIVFLIGLSLSFITQDYTLYLISRFIQGLGLTSASVIMKPIITDNFEGEARVKAFMYMVIGWGLGPIVAPAIGAYLTSHYGHWMASSFFLLIYVLVLLILLTLYKDNFTQKIPISIGNMYNNTLIIFKDRVFNLSFISMGLLYGNLLIFNLFGPFYVQETLAYSRNFFGYIALLNGLCYFLGVFLNRFIPASLNRNKILFIASAMTILAAIYLVIIASVNNSEIINFILPAYLITFFSGIIYPNLMNKGLSQFPNLAGIASSLIGFSLMIISSLLLYIASLINTANLKQYSLIYISIAILNTIFIWFLIKPSKQ